MYWSSVIEHIVTPKAVFNLSVLFMLMMKEQNLILATKIYLINEALLISEKFTGDSF